jgi:hypothetical protein
MPVVKTAWTPGKGYRLELPGGLTKYAKDREEAKAIVAREVPGTVLAFIGR